MRISSNTLTRGLVGAMAAAAVLAGSATVQAQLVPYNSQLAPRTAPQYQQYQAPAQSVPQYQAAASYQQTPQSGGFLSAAPNASFPAPQQYQPGISYQSAPQTPAYQPAPQYTAMAQPAPEAMSMTPGQSYEDPANCNCQAAPAANYTQPAPANYGCDTGMCGGYSTFDSGAMFGCGNGTCGGNYCGDYSALRGCGRQWFGGVYGLYMQRTGNNWMPLAFSTSTANAPPYYPTNTEYVINFQDLDHDFQAGAEVRIGATFAGCGGCDPCGCSCGPRHAWEVAYWGLVDDDQIVSVTDLSTDANRLYGMIDYRGLEYNPGSGYRPANHYFDYGPPTSDYTVGATLDEIQVRQLTARSRFSAQNLEINLLHLPVLSSGCGVGTSCGCDGGSCGTGGCAGGGCGAGGCGVGACGSGCGDRCSVTTLIGARFLRFDDDFMFRTDYENVDTPATGFIAHNVEADNFLVGAQIGCNGTYRCGPCGKWAFHCNSNVGLYGNHMEICQCANVPAGGAIRYANNGNGAFDLGYEEDDVAVVGEARLGCSYQYSCNWRIFGGYRLLGVSGVALAIDQIPNAFISPSQTSYVDADGSIILHGLQTGVEWTY